MRVEPGRLGERAHELLDGGCEAELGESRRPQPACVAAHAVQRGDELLAELIHARVARGGVLLAAQHAEPDQQRGEALGGLVVQLARDALAFLFLGAERAGGHFTEPPAVALEPVEHRVERASEALEPAVGERRDGRAFLEAAGTDRLGGAFEHTQRREGEADDHRVDADADEHSGERDEPDQLEGGALGLCAHELRGQRGAGGDSGDDDHRVGDQDLGEQRHAQRRAQGPGRRPRGGAVRRPPPGKAEHGRLLSRSHLWSTRVAARFSTRRAHRPNSPAGARAARPLCRAAPPAWRWAVPWRAGVRADPATLWTPPAGVRRITASRGGVQAGGSPPANHGGGCADVPAP